MNPWETYETYLQWLEMAYRQHAIEHVPAGSHKCADAFRYRSLVWSQLFRNEINRVKNLIKFKNL